MQECVCFLLLSQKTVGDFIAESAKPYSCGALWSRTLKSGVGEISNINPTT